MNVLANLPRWAQAPTQRFIAQGQVEGTKESPLDQDGFDASYKLASGVVLLAAQDEVPGEDDALGQPGVVRRNGVTVTYDGDSSHHKGQLEAITTGKRRGVEYATYVQAGPNGFSTLQMTNEDGYVEVSASVVEQKKGDIEGYLLAGQFSV